MADELLNIVRKVNAAVQSDKIRRIALSSTLPGHKSRIFGKGEASDGSKIGVYSPKYAKYKSSIGKNPGFVNFRNTDQMLGDYGVVINGQNYAFGFQNSANTEKAVWLEDHFQKEVYPLNDDEVEVLLNVLVDELNKAI